MAEQGSGRVEIDVWSDYVCPFCYLELPALERLEAERPVQVRWRAFELRPEPQPTLDPDGDYLHRVWNASVYPMAADRGMALKLPPVQPRSRLALEAAEAARERGQYGPMHRALFRAFFEEGRDLGDPAVLKEIAGEAGLDGAEVAAELEAGRWTGRVLADQELARRLGVSGVPAMVLGQEGAPQRWLVSGAQPYAALREAVDRVLLR
ncbi:MAG: DsbA family oxidoreductase [Proteobacteria bacterium]|nr:DsbA family oxidoreductase [Pseudomonadota bacterium]